MYYYIILCSGYRTVSLSLKPETDREWRAFKISACVCPGAVKLTARCARSPLPSCLLDSTALSQNHWYDSVGASEASGLDSRWTRTRVNWSRIAYRHIPHGGLWVSVPMRIPLQTFLSKFKGLSALSLYKTGTVPYQWAHVCTYRQRLLAVWCKYVHRLGMPYRL